MKPRPRTLEKINSLFVDRADEIACFKRVIESDLAGRPVYYLIGENEIGKSWLLYKFYIECKAQGWLVVLIDFSRGYGRFTDYLSVLSEIQLTLEQPFKRYQEKTRKALQIPEIKIETGSGDAGRALDIADGAEIEGVTLKGQFSARDINNFYIQLRNQDLLRRSAVVRQLTEAFLKDLVEYVGDRPIIFLFDDIGSDADGKALLDSQTRRWLIEDFIIPLCDDLLPTARFVITQKEELEPDLQTFLSDYLEKHALTEFDDNENSLFKIYQTYLCKHGMPEASVSDELLILYHYAVKGRPAMMFKIAQSLKKR